MILNKEEIKKIVNKVRMGECASDACSHITLTHTQEEFDEIMTDAIFDVWFITGDTHFNRDGHRCAFDAVENIFFPKEKEEKIDNIDEHLPIDWYF